MNDLIDQLRDHSQEEALINLCNQLLEPLSCLRRLEVGGLSLYEEEERA